MSRQLFLAGICTAILFTFSITGCSSKTTLPETVLPKDIYRYRPEHENLPGAKNIQVETAKDGNIMVTALGGDSHVASIMPLGGGSPKFFPDTLGSQNIKIVINKEVGYTEIAGLRFRQEATINIWKDGAVEVDKEGVEASDKNNSIWVARKVRIEREEKASTIMIRKS